MVQSPEASDSLGHPQEIDFMAKNGRAKGLSGNAAAKRRTTIGEAVPPLKIVVTISDSAIGEARRIGNELRDAGMIVETPLEELGQFLGTVAQSEFSKLSGIEGVTAVEVLGMVRVPPSPLDPQ